MVEDDGRDDPAFIQFRDLVNQRFRGKPCGTLSKFRALFMRCSHYKEIDMHELVPEVHKLFSGHQDVIEQFHRSIPHYRPPSLLKRGPKLSKDDILYSSLQSTRRAVTKTIFCNLWRDPQEIIFVREYFTFLDIKFLKKLGLLKYLSDEYDLRRVEVIKRSLKIAYKLMLKIKKLKKSRIQKEKRQATIIKLEQLTI